MSSCEVDAVAVNVCGGVAETKFTMACNPPVRLGSISTKACSSTARARADRTGWFTLSKFPSQLDIVETFDETSKDQLFFDEGLSPINSPSKCSYITKKWGDCLV